MEEDRARATWSDAIKARSAVTKPVRQDIPKHLWDGAQPTDRWISSVDPRSQHPAFAFGGGFVVGIDGGLFVEMRPARAAIGLTPPAEFHMFEAVEHGLAGIALPRHAPALSHELGCHVR